MRHPRKITAEEENFRTEPFCGNSGPRVIRRDPIKPEPEGTFVLMAFRITGYDPDCDGSLMARVQNVSFNDPDRQSGWEQNALGLYKGSDIIVSRDELLALYQQADSK
jgi:hypothetical protein